MYFPISANMPVECNKIFGVVQFVWSGSGPVYHVSVILPVERDVRAEMVKRPVTIARPPSWVTLKLIAHNLEMGVDTN